MSHSKLILKIGGLCLLGGLIFFIIPFFMSHDDTTWGLALALWSIGLVSVILGIVLVISGVLMKPETDGNIITVSEAKSN